MNVRGYFQLEVYDGIENREHLDAIMRGEHAQTPIFQWEKENVVTLLGRKRIAELVAGTSVAFVTEMAIGDDGVSAVDPAIPIIPTVNDTALSHEVAREDVGASIITGQNKAQFSAGFLTASIPPSAYLSVARINEAGLFCSDGVLFARRTYPSVAFGPGDRVGHLIRWNIEVL
jgi:hypothetical protein